MLETPVFQAYSGDQPPRFANPAELECAKVLDYYGVPWLYEPRTFELGAEIARDYDGREPILVGALKSCLVFLSDLSRALPIMHGVDFVELSGYGAEVELGGTPSIRLLKDLDAEIEGRHVIVVEDVVDTGLTRRYLVKTFEMRNPASLAAATLLDWPYRRLVEDLPVRYVGFVVPD